MFTSTSDNLHHLRSLAAAVHAAEVPMPVPRPMSARAAAQCLSGVARLLGLQYGTEEMRRALAELASFAPAWETSLRALPMSRHGASQITADAAVLVRGVLALAGPANTRAALAFWACETDAATMQKFAA